MIKHKQLEYHVDLKLDNGGMKHLVICDFELKKYGVHHLNFMYILNYAIKTVVDLPEKVNIIDTYVTPMEVTYLMEEEKFIKYAEKRVAREL